MFTPVLERHFADPVHYLEQTLVLLQQVYRVYTRVDRERFSST